MTDSLPIRSNEKTNPTPRRGGQGSFITTSDYQPKAYDVASEQGFPRIGLINGSQLVDLLIEHWDFLPGELREKLGLRKGLVRS